MDISWVGTGSPLLGQCWVGVRFLMKCKISHETESQYPILNVSITSLHWEFAFDSSKCADFSDNNSRTPPDCSVRWEAWEEEEEEVEEEEEKRFMQDNTLNSPYVTDCTFLEENQLATSA